MIGKEHLIESLKALCRQYGVNTVAEAIHRSAENIQQIVDGRKLPSGQPRGVGPSLQKALEEHYPGWSLRQLSAAPEPTEAHNQPNNSGGVNPHMALTLLRALFERLQDDQRPTVAQLISGYLSAKKNDPRVSRAILELLSEGDEASVTAEFLADQKEIAAFGVEYMALKSGEDKKRRMLMARHIIRVSPEELKHVDASMPPSPAPIRGAKTKPALSKDQ